MQQQPAALLRWNVLHQSVTGGLAKRDGPPATTTATKPAHTVAYSDSGEDVDSVDESRVMPQQQQQQPSPSK
jgi:hypothetical protein